MVFNINLMGYENIKENPFRNELMAEIRNSRGWSQRELARRANLTQRTVVKIESGHDPKSSTVGRIAAALGVDPKIFFDTEYKFDGEAISAKQVAA